MSLADAGLVPGAGKRARRLASILDLVAERRAVKVEDLTGSLGVSAATARRDLADLADRRLLTRTHGGATLAEGHDERPVTLRDTRFADAKRAIARATMAQLPHDLHVVALSGGTTTAYVARALAWHQDLTVVTNSLTVATILGTQPRVRVVMTGGILRPRSLELVGLLAENTFAAVNIGTAVLGADGVSAEAGVTTHDETEARTNHAMVAKAQRTLVVADGSKIGQSALSRMAPLSEVDVLVTDRSAAPAALDEIRRHGVRVVVADG
jgi:DeoR family transcriptional regulator, aga operon transcriptional repressor